MFSVGMQTSGFESGAKKVDAIRKRMDKEYATYGKAQKKTDDSLAKAVSDREKAEISLSEAVKKLNSERAKGEKASDAQIRKHIKSIEALEGKISGLKAREQELNAERRKNVDTWLNKLNASNKQLKEQNKLVNRIKGSLKSGLNPAFAKLGGVMAGAFSVVAIRALINNLDALAKRAKDLDMNASQLQEFQHQAKLAGIETGALDASLKAANRNFSLAAMGTGEARKALEQMGVSLKKENGQFKSRNELLRESAEYFAKNAGSADNAGKAARIFGESGAELLRIFEQGGDVINKVFDADGIDEAAAAAERFDDFLENVQNKATMVGAKIIEGWSYIADGVVDIVSSGFDITALGNSQLRRDEEAYNAQMKKKRIEEQRIKDEKAKQEAKLKADREKESQKRLEEIYALDRKLEESRKREMSDTEKVFNLKNQIANAQEELASHEKDSVEYLEAYKRLTNDTIMLEGLLAKQSKEKAEAEKKREEDARARAEEIESINESIAESRRKEESDAEKIARLTKDIADRKGVIADLDKTSAEYLEEYKKIATDTLELESARAKVAKESLQIQNARNELEITLRIQRLENTGRTREAEAIRNSLERNRLMKEYALTTEQATKLLENMKKAQGGDKKEYSEEDKKKAEKIIKRSKDGKNVGKKTLEQAQAIMEGRAIDGEEVSVFDGAGGRAKKARGLEFATGIPGQPVPGPQIAGQLPGQVSPQVPGSVQPGALPQSQAVPAPGDAANPEAKKNGGEGMTEALEKILEEIKNIPEVIKEVFGE